MADYYDHSYRQLFSHPELIRDLLEGFVHEDWIKGLDLDTLSISIAANCRELNPIDFASSSLWIKMPLSYHDQR